MSPPLLSMSPTLSLLQHLKEGLTVCVEKWANKNLNLKTGGFELRFCDPSLLNLDWPDHFWYTEPSRSRILRVAHSIAEQSNILVSFICKFQIFFWSILFLYFPLQLYHCIFDIRGKLQKNIFVVIAIIVLVIIVFIFWNYLILLESHWINSVIQ